MSMIIDHHVSIDLTQPGETPRIQIKQGDSLSHRMAVHLFSGGEAWTIPEDAAAVIRYHVHDLDGGEDVNGVYDTLLNSVCAWSVSENIVTVYLTDAMTARHSIVSADVALVEDVRVLSTFNIEIYVNRAPVAQTEPDLQNYYNVSSMREINAEFENVHRLRVLMEARVTDIEARLTALEEA